MQFAVTNVTIVYTDIVTIVANKHKKLKTELLNHNLNINFKIIGVTESRLRQNKALLNSIDLPNYNIE